MRCSNRLGNQFRLKVVQSSQPLDGVEVTSEGPQEVTQLALGRESRVYLGGADLTLAVRLSSPALLSAR